MIFYISGITKLMDVITELSDQKASFSNFIKYNKSKKFHTHTLEFSLKTIEFKRVQRLNLL